MHCPLLDLLQYPAYTLYKCTTQKACRLVFFLTPTKTLAHSTRVSLISKPVCLLTVLLHGLMHVYVFICARPIAKVLAGFSHLHNKNRKPSPNEGSVSSTWLGKGSDSAPLLLPLALMRCLFLLLCLQLFFKLQFLLLTFYFPNRVFVILFLHGANSLAILLFF